jgi:PST family polysaccharide transporter
MVKKRKFSKINVITLILSVFASVIGIVLNLYLARMLEAELFGKLQYLIALVNTCAQFMIFGINSFLIRELKNENRSEGIMNKAFSLYFIVVIFMLPFMFLGIYYFSDHTNNDLLLTFIVLFSAIIMGINVLVAAYHQGQGKYYLSVIFESLIPRLVLFICAIIFIALNLYKGFELTYMIVYLIVYALVAIPFTIKLFKKIDLKIQKSDFISILFLFGVTITYSLGNNLTKVLQGTLFKNNVAIGIISISISIVSLVRIFTAALDNIVKPIFAKLQREQNTKELIQVYRFDTRMNSYLVIPLYLFFIIHSTNFLQIFGESYTVYPNILRIIALAHMVSEFFGPNGTVLVMTGNEKWEMLNGFIYFAFYFLFTFVLSFDKIHGLCWALLFAQIAVNIAKYVEVYLIFKISPLDLKTFLTEILIILVNVLIIFPLKFINTLWLWLLIGIVVGALLVLLNCFVLSLYRKKDFKTFLEIRL